MLKKGIYKEFFENYEFVLLYRFSLLPCNFAKSFSFVKFKKKMLFPAEGSEVGANKLKCQKKYQPPIAIDKERKM